MVSIWIQQPEPRCFVSDSFLVNTINPSTQFWFSFDHQHFKAISVLLCSTRTVENYTSYCNKPLQFPQRLGNNYSWSHIPLSGIWLQVHNYKHNIMQTLLLVVELLRLGWYFIQSTWCWNVHKDFDWSLRKILSVVEIWFRYITGNSILH